MSSRRWSLMLGVMLGLAVLGSASAETGLPPELQRAWAQTGLPAEAHGLIIKPLGQPDRVTLNAERPMNPASVMKLFPTWAALEHLGPGWRWYTRLLVAPGDWPVTDGVLRQPLVLEARGDPALMLEDAWMLLRQLRLKGVRKLAAGMIIDRSRFGEVAIDTNAFDGDGTRPYNASPDALIVGLSATELRAWPEPALGRWQAVMDPALPGVSLVNELVLSPGRCAGQTWQVQVKPLAPGQHEIRVSGALPADCPEQLSWRLVQDARTHAEGTLRMLWQELGGQIDGDIRTGRVPADAIEVVRRESPPLSEVVREINKRSNNLMTRQLVLSLGAELRGPGAGVQQGGEAVLEVLAARGLRFPELVLDNGAGLSREARASARSVARLLESAWGSATMPEFLASMALLGQDGTVRRRLTGSSATGQAHLKTGALRDVRALAGYVRTAKGERWLMVSLVNHPEAHRARDFHDSLLIWIMNQ